MSFILCRPIHHIIYIRKSASFIERSHDIHNSIESKVSSAKLILIFSYIVKAKSGEYDGTNGWKILHNMLQGRFYMRKLTIPEGLSSAQITNILHENEYLIGEISHIPEGTLSPGTYLYTRDSNRESIILKMKSDFQQISTQIWNNNKCTYLTKDEWIIFASIVEKEGKDFSEMQKIATVFRNRLAKKMKLQSCATVLYALTKGAYNLNKIYFKSFKTPSPFNTYIHIGLPLAPITNPSKNALIASINPAISKELFFYHNNKILTVSETFEQHKMRNKTNML